MPEGHELAEKLAVSIHDLVRYPFIGVDPSDHYGQTLARPFDDAGHEIRAWLCTMPGSRFSFMTNSR
ncbi:type 2 periplasmic-binding domain-containing protein [Paracoccus nototheniae]|uniref:Uncharacterized protein n=1 Tax=Paracoccus nototheniae TaxID=2489002 RepID=A0ABW4DW72_9RHOB|nr:hypothetical protein [Paracoccus nototheniae]